MVFAPDFRFVALLIAAGRVEAETLSLKKAMCSHQQMTKQFLHTLVDS
jgi:hypothetical protein